MYIKDYLYAKVVEEAQVLDCYTTNFNPFTRKQELNKKFIGTYQVMTPDGPAQKFHFNDKEELIIHSPEGEQTGLWWIEQKNPETRKEEKAGSILGISFKIDKTTQRHLCAFYHDEGVIMLIPSKKTVYSFDREDYDFGSCMFLVKESSRTGQLRYKTIEEVYDFVKNAATRKMEDKEISKIVITKFNIALHHTMLLLVLMPIFLFLSRVIWYPLFGLTITPPIWLYILCLVIVPAAFIGLFKWAEDSEKKKIAEFRQTRPNEIPDVSKRWEA